MEVPKGAIEKTRTYRERDSLDALRANPDAAELTKRDTHDSTGIEIAFIEPKPAIQAEVTMMDERRERWRVATWYVAYVALAAIGIALWVGWRNSQSYWQSEYESLYQAGLTQAEKCHSLREISEGEMEQERLDFVERRITQQKFIALVEANALVHKSLIKPCYDEMATLAERAAQAHTELRKRAGGLSIRETKDILIEYSSAKSSIGKARDRLLNR